MGGSYLRLVRKACGLLTEAGDIYRQPSARRRAVVAPVEHAWQWGGGFGQAATPVISEEGHG